MNDNNVQPFYSESENGKLSLNNYNFKRFLEHNGIFKNNPNENSSFNLIQREGIFLLIKDEYKIKDFVLDYILDNNLGQKVFNLMSGRTSIFKRDFLSIVKTEEIKTLKDTKDTAYLFYQNGVVEITKGNHFKKEYKDYGLSIWKDQVIKRDFVQADHHRCEFRTFVWMIAGESVDRYNTMQSVLGYLMHSYNSSSTSKAIILNDEMISDDPNGRSGKGLTWNAVKHMKKVQSLDGKSFKFDSPFPYQSIKTDCQVLVYDDVKKNFPFINLFSQVTEGMEITYKGKDTIKLPIEESPKILITTNYALKGRGGSFEARKFEVELSAKFNAGYTPVDHFGHRLFDDWDAAEWARFDCYMIECLKKYLNHGLMPYDHISLPYKKLEIEIGKELFDCMRTINANEWIDIKEFVEKYHGYITKVYERKSQHIITISLKKFASFFDYEYDEVTSNNIKKFIFKENKPNPETLDMWDQIQNDNGIN